MKSVFILAWLMLLMPICFSQSPGDDCANPIVIIINESVGLPFFTSDQTCGRGNAAENSCLGSYDGGEDIFYEIQLGYPVMLEFALNPLGTSWTGMALGYDCPPAGEDIDECLIASTKMTPIPHQMIIMLAPGTYYLMIDTWPSPDCIPAFELEIYGINIPHTKCQDPYLIELPNDAPFTGLNQYTCGRANDYDQTCLLNFDGGEEMIYEIDINVPGQAEFLLDPYGAGYTGLALDSNCPLSESSPGCLALSTSASGTPHGFDLFLEIGTYYLMVDTWPSPECLEDYELNITFEGLICGDANADQLVNVSDAVHIINYVFSGGEEPQPYRVGDTNCDSVVNVSDAVWIINYVFMGGNYPCETDGDGNPDC